MKYAVWLQNVLRYANGRARAVLECFGSARAVYDADRTTLENARLFGSSELSRACDKSLADAEKIISYCDKNGIKILPFGEVGYPSSLLNIPDLPLVLYYKGTLPDFDGVPSVCIVGPRKCSDFGIKASYSLSARLSRGGMIIVSGGAVGVDSAAHRGALAENAVTVALLPCGFGFDYLKENENLREDIIKSGCVMTEFPPMYPVKKGSFQIRNRLMSALTLGVAVIEAGEKSGALITARFAYEQGKDVFVIPGNPASPHYKGSNLLLRDGAKPLLSANDIFDEYISLYNDKLDIEKAFRSPVNREVKVNNDRAEEITKTDIKPSRRDVGDVSEIARAVYGALPENAFCVDELSVFNDYNAAELMTALAELELLGYIKAVPGGRYIIVE